MTKNTPKDPTEAWLEREASTDQRLLELVVQREGLFATNAARKAAGEEVDDLHTQMDSLTQKITDRKAKLADIGHRAEGDPEKYHLLLRHDDLREAVTANPGGATPEMHAELRAAYDEVVNYRPSAEPPLPGFTDKH